MKAIKTYIWMAVATMMVAALGACSSDDFAVKEAPIQKGKTVTLTATLSPKESNADMRALTDNGTTIGSAWVVNEEVCVEYTNGDEDFVDAKGIITAVDDDGKATITVDLINPKEGDSDIFFHYPYNIAKGIKDLTADQIGTLNDIADNFDDFDGDGTLNVTGDVATLPSDVSMTRNVCIWKLAFKVGSSDITNTITALNINISNGAREYDITPNALDAIYVALGNVSNTDVTFTAATPSGIYSFTKDEVTLNTGYFYRSTVTLTAAAASGTYREYSDRTNFDNVPIPGGATIVGNSATDVSWAAGTYVVSSDVTIDGGVTLEGDVDLILKDGAQLTVNGIIDGATNTASLRIFGQTLGTGKLIVNSGGDWVDINSEDLEIHGGIISTINADQTIETNGVLKIYHGTIEAIGPYNGIEALGDLHIYGGNITATATVKERMGIECGGSLVIDGGYIVANGGNATADDDSGGDAISCSNITINGGTVIATGGNGYGDGNGGCGIYNLMMGTNIAVNGGYVEATGGAKGATGEDGKGIYENVNVKSPLKMYVGDSADPSTDLGNGDDLISTKRYVIIQ